MAKAFRGRNAASQLQTSPGHLFEDSASQLQTSPGHPFEDPGDRQQATSDKQQARSNRRQAASNRTMVIQETDFLRIEKDCANSSILPENSNKNHICDRMICLLYRFAIGSGFLDLPG
jgi:hypothetical protein